MGLTSIPTPTDGSAGRNKTDLDAVPDLDHYIPGAEWNAVKNAVCELAEEVGLADGSQTGSVVDRINVIEGSPSTDEIWKWNGTDLTQFTSGATPELDTTGGAALSVVTDDYGNPSLRFTGGGSIGQAQWAIGTSEFPVLPSRFVLETRTVKAEDGSGGLSSNARVGFSYFCQYNGAGDVLAYTIAPYANTNQSREIIARNTTLADLSAGPVTTNQGGSNAGRQGALHVNEVALKIGTPFDMRWFHRGWGFSVDQRVLDSGDGTLDFDSGRFDGETPNTFGFAGGWSVATADFVDFSTIRILKHPMDVTG